VGSDATDKETAGIFVQSYGTSQETREKGIKGGERDEAASVFKNESCGEIGVASLDAGAVFVGGKFSENVVVVQTPAWAIGLGADRAEGFKEFEQSNVVAALALHDGQGIVCSGGVDGKMFFGRGCGERDDEEQEDADSEQ
jgi:hypothetical protein